MKDETPPLQSAPMISVVVPVHNGGQQFEQTLDALIASDWRACEIVVVDDGSTDASARKAHARGVEVLRLASRRGPAAARNEGARRARGEVLLFVDADVVVRRDTIGRVAALFGIHAETAAVFGSYDDAPAASNFVSQYKNLLHHFVHQQASASAETFWAGCGAVRRDAFEAVGGFDESRYARPSIEDIELGYRLRRAGFAVVLDRELQVKHLKRWTFASLLRTDVFNRAIPWSRLILESGGMFDDLNLRVRDRVCSLLVGLGLMLAPAALLFPPLLVALPACPAAVFLLNLRLFRFLAMRRGAWFAARCFSMQCLYYFYSGTVFALCYFAFAFKRASGNARRGCSTMGAGRVKDA
jgi:GT2 family glycosyltransferase